MAVAIRAGMIVFSLLHSSMSSPLTLTGSNTTIRQPQWQHGNRVNPTLSDVGQQIQRPPGLHDTNGSHDTESTSDQVPVSDFLCLTDQSTVVIQNLPCPADSSLKVQPSPHFLEFLWKSHGGSLPTPAVSSHPPSHLAGLDLSDITTADWMNYNQTDFSNRLQGLVRELEKNRTGLLHKLQRSTSSLLLQRITELSSQLQAVVNSSVSQVSPGPVLENVTKDQVSCQQFQAATESFARLLVRAQQILNAVASDPSWELINMTLIDGAAISQGNNSSLNSSDAFIDLLLLMAQNTKKDSRLLADLESNLTLAVDDFREAVVVISAQLLRSVIQLDSDVVARGEFLSLFDLKLNLGEDETITPREDSTHLPPQTSEWSTHHQPLDTTTSPVESSQMVSSTQNSPAAKTTPKDSNNVTTVGDEQHHQHNSHLQSSESPAHSHSSQGMNHLHNWISYNLTKIGGDAANISQAGLEYLEEILAVAIALVQALTELNGLLVSPAGPGEPVVGLGSGVDTMSTWHNLRRRTRRDVVGYTIASDRCQRQGAAAADQTGYLSLCSACVHTTVLDADFYPRYLTEKICTVGSSSNPAFRDGCLFQPGVLGGRPGGACKQQEFHIIVLHRVPGKCLKIISQGQEIITDQWQSTTHPLRIGCECVVDQSSQFAKYTNIP